MGIACFECQTGVIKSGDKELLQQFPRPWVKHEKSFNYAEHICDSCIGYMIGKGGEFEGVKPEAMTHLYFLWGHFTTHYHRIKRDMPKTDESKAAWNMILENRSKFVAQTLTKIHNDPDNFSQHIDAIIKNIYKGVVGKELIMKNKMFVGDIFTGAKR